MLLRSRASAAATAAAAAARRVLHAGHAAVRTQLGSLVEQGVAQARCQLRRGLTTTGHAQLRVPAWRRAIALTDAAVPQHTRARGRARSVSACTTLIQAHAQYAATHRAPKARHASTSSAATAAGLPADEADERAVREDLAAFYRLAFLEGWSPDLIYNHISARVGGSDDDPAYLLNPYGLRYEEVTASSLVVIDKAGRVLDAGSATGVVNEAGFVVHSAVHMARPDLHAVIHTHHADAAAVSAMACGLLPLTQDSMVFGPVKTHTYEGIAVSPDERERIGSDLGPDAKVMLLRNHGVVVGGATIPECFVYAYFVHKACTVQVRALAMAGGDATKVVEPGAEVQQLVARQAQAFNAASGAGFGQLEWAAMRRRLDDDPTMAGYTD